MTKYSDTENPLLSIITVVHNSAGHLEETIKSVVGQDYDRIEYIVVDGGSTDGSLDIIKKYAQDGYIAKFISEPDHGIADAFNKGIALSNGDIIGLINSDDQYLPGVLKRVAEVFGKVGTDCILHGNILRGKGSKKVRIRPRPLPGVWKYVDSPFNHPATFVPRRVYEKTGVYKINYMFAMDYDFYLRAMLLGIKFCYMNEDIAVFSALGRSSTTPLNCHKEVLRSQGENGLFMPLCYLTFVLKVLINRLKLLY
jgi:glycosyltransferase involved in cell wall biosynthesis